MTAPDEPRLWLISRNGVSAIPPRRGCAEDKAEPHHSSKSRQESGRRSDKGDGEAEPAEEGREPPEATYLRLLLRGVVSRGGTRGAAATCVALTWPLYRRARDSAARHHQAEGLFRLVRRSVRSTDVVARLSADVVCVVLPGQTSAGGLAVGKRLVNLWRAVAAERRGWLTAEGVVAAVVFLGDVEGDESALLKTILDTLQAARQRGAYVVCRYQPKGGAPIDLPESPSEELHQRYPHLAPVAADKHVRSALDFIAGHRDHPYLDYDGTLRVADRAIGVADRLGVPRRQKAHIASAALLRDIGMLWLPEPILVRQGPLNQADYRLIKRHPLSSVRRTEPILTEDARHVVMHHHERVDGRGYPRGLRGNQIPLGARIVSVVDAYEAMLSPRPYRPPLPKERAIAELHRESGKQFDPEVVDAFLVN